MALPSKDISFILTLLNEDTCGSVWTFEKIGQQFRQSIPSSDHLRLSNGLLLLLQNRDLTSISQQRLIIFYLFVVMYPIDDNSIDENPFAPVFLSLLEDQAEHPRKHFHWKLSPVTSHERNFICSLIKNRTSEILDKTPNQVLQSVLSKSDLIEQQQTRKELKEKLEKRNKEIPQRAQCHLPAVIDDPEINLYGFDGLLTGFRHYSRDSQQTIESLFSTEAMNLTIAPQYLRLAPPLFDCTVEEMAWLTCDEPDDSMLSWDSMICTMTSPYQEIRMRLERACRGLLSLPEQLKLANDITENEDILQHFDFDPMKLPSLIEHSPSVSFQLLVKLSATEKLAEFLTILYNMEVSVHSIELVNRLSGSVRLSRDFLHQYISICVKACEETKDRYLQNRLVRLVSIFAESLIRSKIIDIRDSFIELQRFSLQFSTVREANALFQLLQTVNSQIDSVDQSNSLGLHEN